MMCVRTERNPDAFRARDFQQRQIQVLPVWVGIGPIPLKLLPNGKVLYAGGLGTHSELTRTAELYDPATETWSLTGSLNTAREGSSAILLPSGLVLLAGGAEFNDPSAELYNPATGTWSYTGLPVAGYYVGEMNLLPTGMVLATVGEDAQLYDPATGTWSATASLHDDHVASHATLLLSGMVLVEGGGSSVQQVLNSAELYDPGTIIEPTTVNGTGFVPAGGGIARFTLRASLSGDRASGTLTYSDTGAGLAFRNGKVRTLTFNGNSAALTGNARLGDGTKVSYRVTVTDGSSDGSSDTFNMTLSNGYSAGGVVSNGDISIQ